MIDVVHVVNQIYHTTAVSEFIIVPERPVSLMTSQLTMR